MIKNFQDGTICHIAFSNTVGHEMNSYHLGVVFNIAGLDSMIFCVPLTSAKEKHFKSKEDFNKRNFLNVKHSRWHYIVQTDSVAQLEQMRMMSIDRIIKHYKCKDTDKIQVLNNEELNLIKEKVTKFLKSILYKKEK